MSYSNGYVAAYQFRAATFDAAYEGFIKGPAGLTGRLVDISAVVTVEATTSASLISVGTQADADAYGTLSVAAGAAETSANGLTRGADSRIPADTLVTVANDGGSDAGDGDILVIIEWS